MMKYERPKLVALSSLNVEGGGPKCDPAGSGASGDCLTGNLPGGSCGFGDAAAGNCTDGNIANVCGVGALR